MGLLDKAKAAAGTAAEKAKEGADRARGEVAELQTKRELSQVHGEIGEKVVELAASGFSHPELDGLVARANELKTQLESE
jgi:hypothetical protein